VLTASGETEYSLERAEDRAAAQVRPSYFTEAVIAGISTGAADSNLDGRITVDELYSFVARRLRLGPSLQRPQRMGHGEGDLVIADAPHHRTAPPPPQGSAATTTRSFRTGISDTAAPPRGRGDCDRHRAQDDDNGSA
jgi:hypothetical protein